MLGTHWLAHAIDAAPEALSDPACLAELLLGLAADLQLTPLSAPLVAPARGGLAGVVLLAESHAAIHADDATRSAMVDVFSCRSAGGPDGSGGLDGDLAAARVAKALRTETVRWHTVARAATAPEAP